MVCLELFYGMQGRQQVSCWSLFMFLRVEPYVSLTGNVGFCLEKHRVSVRET